MAVRCSTFAYCENPGGCPIGDGRVLEYRQCDLKSNDAVEKNPFAPVEVYSRGPGTSLTSGKLPTILNKALKHKNPRTKT